MYTTKEVQITETQNSKLYMEIHLSNGQNCVLLRQNQESLAEAELLHFAPARRYSLRSVTHYNTRSRVRLRPQGYGKTSWDDRGNGNRETRTKLPPWDVAPLIQAAKRNHRSGLARSERLNRQSLLCYRKRPTRLRCLDQRSLSSLRPRECPG